MQRAEVLEKAKQCVCGEREQDYGTPEDNFGTIGRFWSVYLKAAHPEFANALTISSITPKDVAIMMSLLKVARIATGNSADSFVDLAGYAACAGEIATHSTEQKKRTLNEDRCVICDATIPEGSHVCNSCKNRHVLCKCCGSYFPDSLSSCPNCGEKK